MTLRTGQPSAEQRRRQAFSLIELILVMTILVAVFALALPSLSGFFRGQTLSAEARRLLALSRHGQSRAVAEGVPMLLWVDALQSAYGLEEEPGYTDEDAKAVEFTLDKDLRLEVVTSPAPLLTRTGSFPTAKSTSSRTAHANLPTIRFLPDGSFSETSPLAIRLFDRDNASLSLAQSTNRLNYEIRTLPN